MTKVGAINRKGSKAGSLSALFSTERRQRFAHIIASVLIALVMSVALLLEPVDWSIWAMQSRLADKKPSGEIVYLHIEPTISAPDYPADRIRLARALDSLHSRGVSRIFLNLVLMRSNSADADAILAKSMAAWGPKLTIIDRIDVGPDGDAEETRSDDRFVVQNSHAWQGVSGEWPGFWWNLPYSYRTSEGLEPSFAAELARVPQGKPGEFMVDYAVRSRSIPQIAMSDLLDNRASPKVSGKTIVVGTARKPGSNEYYIPGQLLAQPSYVPVDAAETLIRGQPAFVPGFLAVIVLGLFVIGAALIEKPEHRRRGYAAATALPLYFFWIGNPANLRIELSYCLVMLAAFTVLRSRSGWRQRVARIDPDTGLPTFRAFSRQLSAVSNGRTGHVVVAKIHGYETILRTLDSAQRATYVKKLVERLQVGDPKRTVFVDGHYLGWLVDQQEDPKLRSHLEGLRALFAAPVTVGDQRVDVGITFGAATARGSYRERCLAAALVAVESTDEALEPVKLADENDDIDTLWDLSLRARIDAAMEAGEVFCVYQPKVDIEENHTIGVEALVRWEDPERGFIPPLHFVMQCEKAGRMEYLTRYVLQSACSAGKLLHFRGNRITMSVNISATLLTDMRIVGIVRNVLQATGFDASHLVLEITETARIRDLAQASTVLKALKALGTHLSMDDFGVGAANFETLQALPFDEVKIDRQFVSRASTSTKARAITASIVGLGASARIAVVAEGAETKADLQMLREIGCWQVQGFALARPMPLSNLLNFIDRENQLPERTAI